MKEISVSGFKSLENFSLKFHRGLNVIIGPNGSGKTNILNFIEFLAHLARYRLLDAVSRSGGAGKIFRRDKAGALGKTLKFTIKGNGTYTEFGEDETLPVFYEYSAEISLSENNGSLAYTRQWLKLDFAQPASDHDWPISVDVTTKSGEVSNIYFTPTTRKHLQDRYVRKRKSDVSDLQSGIEELIRRSCLNTPLYHILERYLKGANQLIRDLHGAKSFNISPSAVRRAEDIASEPQIEEDGSGLAAVLFALTSTRQVDDYWDDHHYGPQLFFAPDETFTKLVSYSKIVSDAINDITVEPDTIENQLRIFVTVDYGEGLLKLPFSLVSDGTAKWFTLVTAIVTSRAVFAIEEPENFLHPLMQREIVRIVREEFASGQKDAFAVMTTHSETILNCVDPDEMILVHMRQGRSIAKRPSNSDDIRAEINRTGFGAGYYYLAGAIE